MIDLRTEILKEHSKKQCNKIVEWVGDSQKRFDELFLLFLTGEYQGKVLNICFGYVSSPSEPVAVKAFSLTVLTNLAKQYPEILPELKLVIEEQLPHQTAAFISRAKKILPG